ncbi:MAG TPA: hypothetical protein VGD77_10110 [Gemmatimonadaceae bacterium]
MTARHLRLLPSEPTPREPTPAERIRHAARRLGAIGREMAANAEELRSLTLRYGPGAVMVKEAG